MHRKFVLYVELILLKKNHFSFSVWKKEENRIERNVVKGGNNT